MRLVIALLGLFSLIAPHVTAQTASAHAVLHPYYNSPNTNTTTPLQGTVDFVQNNDGAGLVNITVNVMGLQANKNYSIHIHQWGNLYGYIDGTGAPVTNTMSLPSIGDHFNPFNQSHGCGLNNPRHEGDLGNIWVTNSTTWTTIIFQSELIDLGRDMINNNSIIGRTIALRELPDNCTTDAESNLGGILAVGVIGINGEKNNATTDPLTTDQQGNPKATALLFNSNTKQPVGYVFFWTGSSGETHMSGLLHGFKPFSEHGIHIHASGNEDTNITIGGHWSGNSTVHALPPNPNRHWGDLGNVVADANGDIIFTNIWGSLNLISIQNPVNSILGRVIAIHEFADTGDTVAYGPRYNFGVIGLDSPDFVLPTLPNPTYPSIARAQVIFRPFYNNSAVTWYDAPLQGNVTFTQNVDGGIVNVTVMIAGLKGNHDYGLHVHQYGNEIYSFNPTTGAPLTNIVNLGNATTQGIGGHLNPWNASHSCFPNLPRHVGDIGNVTVGNITDADRYTFFAYNLTSELLDLGRNNLTGDSIIGRTITLHDAPNPCDPTTPLGNWIAIGVIGIDTSRISDPNLKEQNVAQQDDNLPASNDNNSPKANAVLRDIRDGRIVGDLFFWRGYNNEIRMSGVVAGFMANSTHGVHIHQFGNENSNLTIGPHWAAPGEDGNDFHQLPPYPERHYGDVIGTVTADAHGVVTFNNYSNGFELLSLTSASRSIIGHSIAFHEYADNGSATSYGPRYRFGVIGLAAPDFPIPNMAAINIPAETTPTATPSSSSSSGTNGNTTTPTPTAGNGNTTTTPTPTPTPSTGGNTNTTTPTPTPSTGGNTNTTTPTPSTGGNSNTTTPTPTSTPTTKPPPNTATTINTVYNIGVAIIVACMVAFM